MAMKLTDFINKIKNLESNANDLLKKTFESYPVIRINIFTKYFRSETIAQENKLGILITINTITLSVLTYFRNPVVREQYDLLFLTRTSETELVEGGLWRNRNSDPFVHFFKSKYRIKSIETVDSHVSGIRNYFFEDTTNILLKTLFVRIKSKIKSFFKSVFDMTELNRHIKSIFGYEVDCNYDLIYINELSHLYLKLLKNYKPKLVFLACYYRPDAMAITIAANKLNIRVVEYQHGAQNDTHALYSNWNLIPKSGYEMIPNIFWMWGKISADRINKWASNTTRHSAVVGGNLWLAYQLETNSEVVLAEDGDNKLRILVSLQGDERFPTYLLDYLESDDNEFKWYFRNHPRLVISEDLEMKLNRFTEISVEETSDKELYPFLKQMDIHITGHSTVGFEAQSFNIPNIFTHKNAKDGYSDLLGKNGLFYADNLEEFKNKINYIRDNIEEIRNNIKPDYIVSDISIAENTLKSLMKL